jgi:hypothetical protein
MERKSILTAATATTNENDEYLLIAINDGHVEASFSLGLVQGPSVLGTGDTNRRHSVLLRSTVNVTDGVWHQVRFTREGQIGRLTVDNETAVTTADGGDSTKMNTDGPIWIGGCDKHLIPFGAHDQQQGFQGCLRRLRIGSKRIDMVRDGQLMLMVDTGDHRATPVSFCGV